MDNALDLLRDRLRVLLARVNEFATDAMVITRARKSNMPLYAANAFVTKALYTDLETHAKAIYRLCEAAGIEPLIRFQEGPHPKNVKPKPVLVDAPALVLSLPFSSERMTAWPRGRVEVARLLERMVEQEWLPYLDFIASPRAKELAPALEPATGAADQADAVNEFRPAPDCLTVSEVGRMYAKRRGCSEDGGRKAVGRAITDGALSKSDLGIAAQAWLDDVHPASATTPAAAPEDVPTYLD